MKATIDSKINIALSDLSPSLLKTLKKTFTRGNPEFYKKQAMGFYTGTTPRNIYLYTIKDGVFSVMRGLMPQLEQEIDGLEIVDNRLEIPLESEPEFRENFALWPEQEEAISAGELAEVGLLQGSCGAGKTEMLLGLFKRLGQRTIVLVNTIKLLEQWYDRANARFKNVKIGKVLAGKYEIADLTIASQKTVLKHLDKLKNEFGCLMYDEVHGASAQTPLTILNEFPAKFKIGATATPKRKDKKEFLFFGAFGEIFYILGDEVLLKKGKIHEIKMIVVPTEFNTDKYVKLAEVETLDGTLITKVVKRDYHALLNAMNADEDRNRLILGDIKREIDSGHKCLVMSDRIADCMKWREILIDNGIKVSVMLSASKAKENDVEDESDNAVEMLKKGKIDCIIISPFGNTGLDIPMLDRGFIVTPSASNSTKQIQQCGRIKRIAEGKEDAAVFYYWDRNVYNFGGHLANINKIFKDVSILRRR